MPQRRVLALLCSASAALASSFGCARLFGFEHGVPLPADCDACALGGASGGEPSQGGEGGAPSAGSGGAIGGGGAGSRPPASGGSDSGGNGAASGTRAAGGTDAAGGNAGGSTTAGAGAGGMAGKKGGGGSGGAAECTLNDCPNPDAEHCTVACSVTEGAVACDVSPRDKDGDRHGDARCVVAGDDCDDTNGAIGPGATEICDGVDNDCDRKRDLEQGFAVDAEDLTLPDAQGSLLAPAYSPESGRFLMAWRPKPGRFSGPGVAYTVVDLEGNVTREGFVPSDAGEVHDLSLAAGAGGFAIFWANDAGAHFQRISGEGELGTSRTVTASGGVPALALAHTSGGGWTTFWQEDLGMWARRVGDDDALGLLVELAFNPDNAPMVAVAAGDTVLLGWQLEGRGELTLMPTSLVGGRDLDLGLGGNGNPIHGAAYAGRPEGFGVFGVYGFSPVFEIFDTTGVRRCGPVALRSALTSFEVAPSVNGFVLIAPTAVEEYDLDCRVQQHAATPAIAVPGALRLASAGAEGFLMTWQDSHTDPATLGWRLLGPHLCD
jgi:hypothetical protein